MARAFGSDSRTVVELERGTSGGTGGAGIGGRTGANLVRKISAFRLKRGEKTNGAKDVPGPSIKGFLHYM